MLTYILEKISKKRGTTHRTTKPWENCAAWRRRTDKMGCVKAKEKKDIQANDQPNTLTPCSIIRGAGLRKRGEVPQ